jgi:hypothetical protein
MSTEMEHSNEQNLYTERYLQGELSAEEQDAFEEHFFNCQTCGDDVFTAARMMAVRRDVAEAERKAAANVLRPDVPRWRHPFLQTVAASIVSAFLGAYGAVQYLAPRASQVPLPAIELVTAQGEIAMGEERGPEAAAKTIDPSKGPASVSVLIPSRDDAESYVISVRDSAGKDVFSAPVSRTNAQNYQELVVRRELPRGNYRVVIEGVRKGGIRFSIDESPLVVGER